MARGRALVAVLFVAALFVAACSSVQPKAAPRTASTAAPSTSTSTTAASPTTVAPGTCPVPPRVGPDPRRPRYALHLDVRPDDGRVVGDEAVTFLPDVATDRLVLRLWANGPNFVAAGGRLDAGPVTVDGAPARVEQPDPTTLVVLLGRTVAPGSTVRASLPWTLTLPTNLNNRIARAGEAVRLGSFFPMLAWEPGVGWATEPPVRINAETSTAPTADFELDVTAPADRQVFATGSRVAPTHWTATAVRDVNVVVGRFRTAEGDAGPVHVTVAVDDALPDDPRSFLRPAIGALDDFSNRFGAYPWPTYTIVVTPSLRGGIEYPMVVSAGSGSYGRSTPHEVGHQWFYGLVGNDQARDPWLDEGLASWAEARAMGTLPRFLAMAVPADARGRAGAPMTYWDGRASYYAGVYVQGLQALAALGDPDRVDCALRIYVARNAYRIARPDDLVRALEAVFPNARAILARFGAVQG